MFWNRAMELSGGFVLGLVAFSETRSLLDASPVSLGTSFYTLALAALGLFFLAWDIPSWRPGVPVLIGMPTVIWLFITSYASIYARLGIVDNGTETHDGLTCLYLSVITWTTTGFGEVVPSKAARMYAASEAVTGYIAMVVFISTASKIIGPRNNS